jgi:alpha-glucosidase
MAGSSALESVCRHRDPSRTDQQPPSLAFVSPPRIGAAAKDVVTRVGFGEVDGCPAARVAIGPGTSLYGTGEVAGPLLRNGSRVVCWNSDTFGYTEGDESLYQSHPWVLAVRADGTAFGVFADTTHRCAIDLTDGIVFRAEGPAFDVYLLEANTAQAVLSLLADLTGHAPLPPRWALGYHQCRWGYEPDARVREVAREVREHRMPCDVIWLDIDYMDGFRCFTFDPEKFPDPSRLNKDLHAQGFRTVWMIDPGIKVDPDYSVYAQGVEGDHFVRTADGEEFHGNVWPGACAFPDFLRAQTRAWWAGLYAPFMATGIDGVWNDMNEPSVFDVPSKTMDEDCVHRADNALGGPDTHARYHNVYGLAMVRASREGIAAANPDKRPFVLTRSNFMGGPRYAWTWTGDNVSDWTHLRWSISMVLNLGLSGQPFSGPDIGGFAGDPSGRLFARWMGIGSLLPFARGHAEKSARDKEPWAFGEECERVCRLALERRYRLLPHLYSLAWQASVWGYPIVQPLWFADPTDPALRDVEDSFLLGGDLLVRCRVDEHRACPSPMPKGGWHRFEPLDPGGAQTLADEELPEVYISAGRIVTLGPIMQYSDEKPMDPLTLVVCLDEKGQAIGGLYDDAGEGFGYEKGQFRHIIYLARLRRGRVRVKLWKSLGGMERPTRNLEIIVVGAWRGQGTGRDGEKIFIDVTRAADVTPRATPSLEKE